MSIFLSPEEIEKWEAKDIPTKEEYNLLKAKIEEHAKRKRRIIAIVAFFYGFITLLWFITRNDESAKELQASLLISTLLIPFILPFFIVLDEVEIDKKRRKMRLYELNYMQNEVEDDPFQNSIKTSYKYLDRYYDETQKQAQQGFRITVFIAVCGAALICGGVIAMYFGKVEPAYITCASGAITELISAIFFYLYNKTVTSMSRYHNKLVLSQNISFALRVADSLSEEKKDDAKLAIVKELMKDVNAQMMKSDADTDEPTKKDKPSDNETPS